MAFLRDCKGQRKKNSTASCNFRGCSSISSWFHFAFVCECLLDCPSIKLCLPRNFRNRHLLSLALENSAQDEFVNHFLGVKKTQYEKAVTSSEKEIYVTSDDCKLKGISAAPEIWEWPLFVFVSANDDFRDFPTFELASLCDDLDEASGLCC